MRMSAPRTQSPRTAGPRTVVVVSSDPQARVLPSVLRAIDHAVLLVGSTADAYSRIKATAPDLVIVCLSSGDVDGCLVLSMLGLDRETARIPVLTLLTAAAAGSDVERPTRTPPVFSAVSGSALN